MRKLFLFFVALIATTALWAQRFQVGDLYYNITSSSAPYTVEVSNAVSSITTAVIPSTVTYNGTIYSVTNIGDIAFDNDSSLASITIPNSVTSIGAWAFYDCSSLTSVTIPNGVTSIGDYAFRNCSSLTSVTIGESVTSIGVYAFYNCSSLTSITIPNSVTSIGDWAFSDCSSISSVTIPKSVISIGDYAFLHCLSLTSITIPESVINIGEKAFENCQSLTSIIVGKGVTSIGERAFAYCSSLASIVVEADNTTYDSRNDCNAIIETVTNTLILGCQNTIIPNTITSIGDGAFSHSSSLTSVTIPNSVTNIGNSAFNGCPSLNEVILGTGLKTIDAYAFANCTKLYDIYCLAAEPPTGYTSSFTNYNAFIHVPCESQRLYMLDVLFGEFKYIECIESEDVSTNGVVITPSTNDVTIIWPTETGADTYTIVIKKGDEIFCTLIFNADGLLLNIAYAPGRDGNHSAQYAEQAGNGYRFTVTGLEEGAHYTYNIDVRDAANKTIKSYSGEFTAESMTAVENITTNNANIQKILRDGQLRILRDGVEYTIMGAEIK